MIIITNLSCVSSLQLDEKNKSKNFNSGMTESEIDSLIIPDRRKNAAIR